MSRVTSVSYEDYLIADIKKDPKEGVLYLRECMQDEDPKVFLLALRQVSKALGGVAKVAEETGLNREHLYKTLSADGNPTWASVNAVVNALGMQFSIQPKEGRPAAKRKPAKFATASRYSAPDKAAKTSAKIKKTSRTHSVGR